MKGFNHCATAALLLVLSQACLIRLTSGHYPKFLWDHYLDGQPDVSDKKAALPRDSGLDDPPGDAHPDLKKDFVEFYSSPQDAAAAAEDEDEDNYPDHLSMAWEKSVDALGLENAGKPLGFQSPVFKQPVDFVGSDFMKTGQTTGGDGATKRGLVKRPLDHLGMGLLKKKRLQKSEKEEKNPFQAFPKQSLKVPSQSSGPQHQLSDQKQSSVELIKKGLDVLGRGIFKRDSQDSGAGLEEVASALGQLSQGLGSGNPEKAVDIVMIKRGLDHLGRGLLKRGQESVGIGLIKRALDNLQLGLGNGASTKFLITDGVALLNKGLDRLQTGLLKAGFDQDAVHMITTGAINLASWIVRHRADMDAHRDGKSVELSQKYHDDSEFSKKSLGVGLMKKESENEGDVATKSDGSKIKSFVDKDLRRKKKADNFKASNKHKYTEFRMSQENKGKRAGTNGLRYADIKAAFHEDLPEREVAHQAFQKALIKNIKPVNKRKGSYDVPVPPEKKGLDEVGSGLMKKGLDEVGSGLMKKGFDEVGSRLMKKGLDEVGSGLMKKGLDETGSGLMKKGLDEVGSGLMKKGLDEVGSGLMKKGLDEVGSGLMKKGLDEVGSGLMKKGLDEVGSGLTKKDLDYVGLGLMKKDADFSVFNKNYNPDAVALHKVQHPWFKLPNNEEKEGPQPHGYDKPEEIQKKKIEEKYAGFHQKTV